MKDGMLDVEMLVKVAYLLILSIYDVRERKVPLVLLGIGGVFVVLQGIHYGRTDMLVWMQLLVGSFPGVFLLIVAWASKKAGYADGVVLMLLGMTEGYREGIVLLCVSLLLLSGLVILLLFLRKVKRNTRMPYIPFLTGAYLLLRLA